MSKAVKKPMATLLYINSTDPEAIFLKLKSGRTTVQSQVFKLKPGEKDKILPLVLKFLRKHGVLPPSTTKLSGIEVSGGKGNFTTTRLGATIAQALGLALNLPVKVSKI